MTPRSLLVAAALLACCILSGCNDPSTKLIGKWHFSANASGDNPILSMVVSQLKGEHEFKKDGTFSMTAKSLLGERTISGTWRFVKADGNALVVVVKSSDSPENERRLEFTDDDHFSTVPLESNEATKDIKLDFTRVK